MEKICGTCDHRPVCMYEDFVDFLRKRGDELITGTQWRGDKPEDPRGITLEIRCKYFRLFDPNKEAENLYEQTVKGIKDYSLFDGMEVTQIGAK